MKVYSYDEQGFFVGSLDAQIDPLESKAKGEPVYLEPAGATFTEPSVQPGDGEALMWTGKEWIVAVPQPMAAAPESTVETLAAPELTAEQIAAQSKFQEHQVAAEGARARLLNARADGISLESAPAVLEDILVLLLGAK